MRTKENISVTLDIKVKDNGKKKAKELGFHSFSAYVEHLLEKDWKEWV